MPPRLKHSYSLVVIFVLLALASLAHAQQEHPFLLFTDADYTEFRNRAALEPWANWKAEAMQYAVADWSPESNTLKKRGREDSEVISCNALLYILDPDNAATYRAKIVEGIAVVADYPNGSKSDWMYHVPPGSAGFVSLVALDVIWDDLDPAVRTALLTDLATRINNITDDTWELNPTGVKGALALMQGDMAEYAVQRDGHLNRMKNVLLTPEGGFSEGSTYGLDRMAAASWERYSKAFFIDVIHQQGDYNIYGDQQLQNYFRWALTFNVSPAKHATTFGDTYFSSTPINSKHASSVHRLYRFGDDIGAMAIWALGDTRARANLFSYVLTEQVPTPAAPTSHILGDAGAAFIDPNLPDGETNFAALWTSTVANWHSHKDTNGLYLEAFGTPILANTGYANASSGWNGYSWNYINHQAYGNNVVLINGADHAGKEAAGVRQGFTATGIDFAQGDSGNAINNGTHYRNLVLMHADPNLSTGSYYVVIDEVSAGSASLLFHPVTTTHSEITADTHYRFPIEFRDHTRTDFNLDIFFGQSPDSVSFQMGAMTSYSDDFAMETEYIRANYVAGVAPVTTIIYPHDSVHPLAPMAQLSVGNYQGATVSHSANVIDYLLSSPGDQEVSVAGNTVQGKGLVLRENAGDAAFALVIDGTKFLDDSGYGFESAAPVSVLFKDGGSKVTAAAPATVTFHQSGVQSVLLNGQQLTSESKGEDYITVQVPAGSHEFELSMTPEPAPPSYESAVYVAAAGDAYIRDGSFGNDNYGSGNLQLKGADVAGYERKVLVQFDLASLPRQPGWGTFRMNLKTAAQEAPNTPVRISLVESDWSESQVTGNSAPLAISALAGIDLPEAGQFFSVTVPAQVLADAWENNALVSFQIEALEVFGGNGIILHSSEDNDEWLRPALIVTQTGSAAQCVGSEVTAIAATSMDAGSTPDNLIDDDLGSAWVANGDGAIATIDLGVVVPALCIDVVFAHGYGQTSYFDLAVSNDGVNFSPLLTGGQSSAPAGAAYRHDASGAAFRYLRLIGHGGNVDDWNRVAEIRILSDPQPDSDADELPDSWEQEQFSSMDYDANTKLAGSRKTLRDAYAFGQGALDSAQFDLMGSGVRFYAEPALGSGYEGLSRFFTVEISEDLQTGDWQALPGYSRIPASAEWIEVQDVLDMILTNPDKNGFARVRAWLE